MFRVDWYEIQLDSYFAINCFTRTHQVVVKSSILVCAHLENILLVVCLSQSSQASAAWKRSEKSSQRGLHSTGKYEKVYQIDLILDECLCVHFLGALS